MMTPVFSSCNTIHRQETVLVIAQNLRLTQPGEVYALVEVRHGRSRTNCE